MATLQRIRATCATLDPDFRQIREMSGEERARFVLDNIRRMLAEAERATSQDAVIAWQVKDFADYVCNVAPVLSKPGDKT